MVSTSGPSPSIGWENLKLPEAKTIPAQPMFGGPMSVFFVFVCVEQSIVSF